MDTTPAPDAWGIAPPDHRLPPDARLGRVRLQVADLDRSLPWYERVLGLRAVRRDERSAALAPAGEDVVLVELEARTGARPVPRHGLLGLYHFAVLLPDRAALGRFVRHLAAIGLRAGMSDHAVSEAVYLQDPDNLGIEVYADRPRETWRAEGRQLYMTTQPLDVESLAAAAGRERWAGLPAGTRIGHVHLHVGDIAGAAAFYHRALGFDQTVWSYPGALFMSAGGYHHHLGTNTWAADAPAAGDDDARLLEWTVELPTAAAVDAAAHSLEAGGHAVEREGSAAVARDPWGTRVRVAVADTEGAGARGAGARGARARDAGARDAGARDAGA